MKCWAEVGGKIELLPTHLSLKLKKLHIKNFRSSMKGISKLDGGIQKLFCLLIKGLKT